MFCKRMLKTWFLNIFLRDGNIYFLVFISKQNILKERKTHYQIFLQEIFYRKSTMSHKDKYGIPITEKKITKTPTIKQVLQTPSSSSQLPNQNRFTLLTSLALLYFYPTTSLQPKTIRPTIQSQLISPLQFALNTPSQLNTPTQKP